MKNKDNNYVKLVEYKRGNLTEQEHMGCIVHLNEHGVIKKLGDKNNYKFYHRSCMKPLQAASMIDLNLDKKYKFSLKEIAIMSASHTGDIIHQKQVLSVLNKIKAIEDNLICNEHEPLSKKECERLIKNSLKFRKIHNNCSGKHAMMLAICKDKNFSIENYNDYKHPLTEIIISKVCELCNIDKSEVIMSKDGCSLPVIASTLEELGRGYLNLFLNPKYEKIKNAFLKYPYLIGGEGRLDSELINATDNIIAKVGAGGLCVVVNLIKKEAIVVKIADSDMQARSFVVINSLLQKKWLEPDRLFSNPLKKIYTKEILSQKGEILGEIFECFSL